MSIVSEFKEFAIKGNVMDMAVGIVIGAAFSTVVKSMVDDIIMPPIAVLTGGVDFTNKYVLLQEGAEIAGPYTTLAAAREAGATTLSYGVFINNTVSFLIVAFVIFMGIRWMNKLRSPETPPAPNTKPCEYCLNSIDKRATRCPHCTAELTVALS